MSTESVPWFNKDWVREARAEKDFYPLYPMDEGVYLTTDELVSLNKTHVLEDLSSLEKMGVSYSLFSEVVKRFWIRDGSIEAVCEVLKDNAYQATANDWGDSTAFRFEIYSELHWQMERIHATNFTEGTRPVDHWEDPTHALDALFCAVLFSVGEEHHQQLIDNLITIGVAEVVRLGRAGVPFNMMVEVHNFDIDAQLFGSLTKGF
jgi:hypothetical protein